MRSFVFQAAKDLDIKRSIHEGTYAFVSGPTFETRAEVRCLNTMGADVVGMSTVPEIIVARHGGLRTLAMSLVTNVAVTQKPPSGKDKVTKDKMDEGIASHNEVLEAGKKASEDIEKIVEHVVNGL